MSRQRSGRYAVRSGKRTDILGIQNPRSRFTTLERWLPRITARKLRSVVLKSLKVIRLIFKIFQWTILCVSTFTKKYLPTCRMVPMTLRVTWSHKVQYYCWNLTIIKSKANFDAFRTSTFIYFPYRVFRGVSQYIGD